MWLGNAISQFVKVEMGECFNVTFYCRCKLFDRARLRVRVGALLLAEGWDDIDESSVVLKLFVGSEQKFSISRDLKFTLSGKKKRIILE